MRIELTGIAVDHSKSNFLPSPFLVNRAAPISVSSAFGPHRCVSTVNAAVEDWPSGSTVCFTPMLFPEVLNAKQGNSMTKFLVFGLTRLGIEPRPTVHKAIILPLGYGRGCRPLRCDNLLLIQLNFSLRMSSKIIFRAFLVTIGCHSIVGKLAGAEVVNCID